jgi:hypothetical protein
MSKKINNVLVKWILVAIAFAGFIAIAYLFYFYQ